jgi:hypothetical protein
VIEWFVSSPSYLGEIQANIFDGKSDGKSFLSTLPLRFTVRRSGGRRGSLQFKVFPRLKIARFRKSLGNVAGSLRCRNTDMSFGAPGLVRFGGLLNRFEHGMWQMAGFEQVAPQPATCKADSPPG